MLPAVARFGVELRGADDGGGARGDRRGLSTVGEATVVATSATVVTVGPRCLAAPPAIALRQTDQDEGGDERRGNESADRPAGSALVGPEHLRGGRAGLVTDDRARRRSAAAGAAVPNGGVLSTG